MRFMEFCTKANYDYKDGRISHLGELQGYLLNHVLPHMIPTLSLGQITNLGNQMISSPTLGDPNRSYDDLSQVVRLFQEVVSRGSEDLEQAKTI